MNQKVEVDILINESAVERRYECHSGENQSSVDNVEDYIEEA